MKGENYVVGFDIDDTLILTLPAVVVNYAKQFGGKIPGCSLLASDIVGLTPDRYHDLLPYLSGANHAEILGISEDDYITFFLDGQDTWLREIPPAPWARVTLAWLRNHGHKILAITARSSRLRAVTTQLLNDHSLFFDELFMNEEAVNFACDKATVCLENGVHIFADDSINHCVRVAAVGVQTFLPHTVFSANVSMPPSVQRINSLCEIISAINKRLE
jgi:uncharacterized HAD superfamily protein